MERHTKFARQSMCSNKKILILHCEFIKCNETNHMLYWPDIDVRVSL